MCLCTYSKLHFFYLLICVQYLQKLRQLRDTINSRKNMDQNCYVYVPSSWSPGLAIRRGIAANHLECWSVVLTLLAIFSSQLQQDTWVSCKNNAGAGTSPYKWPECELEAVGGEKEQAEEELQKKTRTKITEEQGRARARQGKIEERRTQEKEGRKQHHVLRYGPGRTKFLVGLAVSRETQVMESSNCFKT